MQQNNNIPSDVVSSGTEVFNDAGLVGQKVELILDIFQLGRDIDSMLDLGEAPVKKTRDGERD